MSYGNTTFAVEKPSKGLESANGFLATLSLNSNEKTGIRENSTIPQTNPEQKNIVNPYTRYTWDQMQKEIKIQDRM